MKLIFTVFWNKNLLKQSSTISFLAVVQEFHVFKLSFHLSFIKFKYYLENFPVRTVNNSYFIILFELYKLP